MRRQSNSERSSNGGANNRVERLQSKTASRHLELETVAFLAAIVESSNDAIISKDLNGIITSWNQGAEHIFGYKSSEAIGRPISVLIPPEHIKEEDYILDRVRRGERVEHFETVRLRKNGSDVDVSVTVSPIRDANGAIIGASKIARDISKEHEARERLRKSEQRFRVTLASIGDAVIATDKDDRVTFMNALAENLTGWKEKDAAGVPLDSIFRILNEVTRQPVEDPVARVIKTGAMVGLGNHTILISKDGREQPIDDSAAPIRGRNGDVDGVVLVFRDATEQRAAEMTARKLTAFVENSEDAIYSMDLDGIIRDWNPAAERIFGYGKPEIVIRSVSVIIPQERADEEGK